MADQPGADRRRWWAESKKKSDHLQYSLSSSSSSPLHPSAPPSGLLSHAKPGKRSSSAPRPHKQGVGHEALTHTRVISALHSEEESVEDANSALTLQKPELEYLSSPDYQLQFAHQSVPTGAHLYAIRQPQGDVSTSIRNSILEMEQQSIIKALELEKVGSLMKQKELEEEVEMLKGVIAAVSEEFEEEVTFLKVYAAALSLGKKELQEEVERLKDEIRSKTSEREQYVSKILALEMVVEESREEVERLKSEQYVVSLQMQELRY